MPGMAHAQQTGWAPKRIPAQSSAKPLASQPRTSAVSPSGSTQKEHLGSGVVLRWKTPQKSNVVNGTAAPHLDARTAFGASWQSTPRSGVPSQNPLRQVSGTRNSGAVRTASYQQDNSDPFSDPFGESQSAPNPQTVPNNTPNGGLPPLPGQSGDLNSQQSIPSPSNPFPGDNRAPGASGMPLQQNPSQQDPLRLPETAPGPESILQDPPASPFPAPPSRQDTPSASDEQQPINPLPDRPQVNGQGNSAGNQLDLPNRTNRDANLPSCDELRSRVLARPLSDVKLDVSPSFGEGLRSVNRDTEKERQEFALQSQVREWSDYTGLVIATGRLIDLQDDNIVLDVDGATRRVPLRDLSDVDIAYVGDAWNIPLKCGNGNPQYSGRNFVPSAVQWKAPGHSHKPAYFEQVQLERYGHEVGPVLQPLISTAHFFGNIAVLPYKMGIHPPNECQYSLGYYRPGNCAPYMVQPVPISLRGAAVQAAAVTGAAALLP